LSPPAAPFSLVSVTPLQPGSAGSVAPSLSLSMPSSQAAFPVSALSTADAHPGSPVPSRRKSLNVSPSLSIASSHAAQPTPARHRSLASVGLAQPGSPFVSLKSTSPSLSLSTPSSHAVVPSSLASSGSVQPGSPAVSLKSTSP